MPKFYLSQEEDRCMLKYPICNINMREIETLDIQTKGIPFNAGGGSLKHRYSLYINDKEVKIVGRPDFGYSENWLFFSSFGMPVFKKIYSDKSGFLVYTPDITADGSGMYGKGTRNIIFNIISQANDSGLRVNKNMDTEFITIMEEKRNIIHNMCVYWANYASRLNFYLPWDDPFEMIIRPNGSWGLMCLDLETGGRPDHSSIIPENILYLMSHKSIYEVNISLVRNFLMTLDEINQNLKTRD